MIVAFVDGEFSPNGGIARGIITHIKSQDKTLIKWSREGYRTSNEAEWASMMGTLQIINDLLIQTIPDFKQKIDRIIILADSRLTVNHINGAFKKTAKHLKLFKKTSIDYVRNLKKHTTVNILWIPRKYNIADQEYFESANYDTVLKTLQSIVSSEPFLLELPREIS